MRGIPNVSVVDFVFAQIEAKVTARYIIEQDGYEELAEDCCSPRRPCQDGQEFCSPFSSLSRYTKEHILREEIEWPEAECGGCGHEAGFSGPQQEAIIQNVAAGKPRERWLEGVPGLMELVKNSGRAAIDQRAKRRDIDLDR